MNKLYIQIVLALTVLFSSCNLDENPRGIYHDDNFYKSVSDAEAAIYYAYNTFNFIEYHRGIFSIGELPADLVDLKNDESVDWHNLNNWNTESHGINLDLENFYKYCYIGINRANAIISKVPNSDFSDEYKEAFIAEAKVIRAWSYFSLVRVFGLTPLSKSIVESIDQAILPMPEDFDELYDFIIEDLTAATEVLKENKIEGRFDLVGTQAILAKVYITIASGKANNAAGYRTMAKDANDMYAQAATWAGKVMSSGSYGFEEDLGTIYDVNKKNGQEHIWLLSMDKSGVDEGEYSKIPMLFLPNGAGSAYHLKVPNSEEFIKTANGFGSFEIEESFYNSFEEGDLRKSFIQGDIYDENGVITGSVTPESDTITTILSRFSVKYVDHTSDNQKTSVTPFMIRFTDIALVYAEAVGPGEGLSWLNRVRGRAGLNPLSGMSLEQFRQAVIEERKYEFAFEAQRLYDLRRTASVTANVPNATLSEDDAAFFEIPQKEKDLNPNIPN
ncbi:RagB/SusD family nutrient uptake outer membrane protein [Saccharicrinis aurantiacus]|uniref:RagB/SusD family nutrient uptake outer membrane protein n=1 Tax=Saccharicrinis aurantiacus TaxID=1849719 RepID=UPI0009FA72C2|nr:RagB/SusD family nutrient uptake outer membrane protein [Saccharicrinis aurantiacus]